MVLFEWERDEISDFFFYVEKTPHFHIYVIKKYHAFPVRMANTAGTPSKILKFGIVCEQGGCLTQRKEEFNVYPSKP